MRQEECFFSISSKLVPYLPLRAKTQFSRCSGPGSPLSIMIQAPVQKHLSGGKLSEGVARYHGGGYSYPDLEVLFRS